MKALLLIITTIIINLVSVSCNREKAFDCVKKTGEVQEDHRSLPPFHEIILRDGLDLVFVPDTTQKVVVKAGKNLLSKIYTTVQNGTLTLENQNYCNWVRSYEKETAIYIHHDTANLKLYHRGFGSVSGKIHSNRFYLHYFAHENSELEFDSDFLWLEMFHLGNVTLKGTIREVASFRHETGQVRASALNANIFRINDHGQGESHISASESAVIAILGTGNVLVHGNPTQVEIIKEGTGEVILK